jgi:hypothetical protein
LDQNPESNRYSEGLAEDPDAVPHDRDDRSASSQHQRP